MARRWRIALLLVPGFVAGCVTRHQGNPAASALPAEVEVMLSLETLGCDSVRSHRKRSPFATAMGLPREPDEVAFLSKAMFAG
jgi:hypothetical protein